MSGAPTFEAGGVEFALKPDPAGVVVRVQLAGALAAFSRSVVLPHSQALLLAAELEHAARVSRNMAASLAEAAR